MKKALLAMMMFSLFTAQVYASEAECKKLKDDRDIIYAAKGFCFKDDEAKKKFGTDCYTSSPKFSDKEQQRLDEIKARQKELNCK